MSFIWFLILGALAGWIAGELMRGRGFGVFGNIVIGILGALIGGYLFRAIGVNTTNSFLGSLITAVVGAVILLFIVGLFRRSGTTATS